ncbi:BZ3500_MvSof-1268-A1-R1_Chr7-3g09668 [Microbotryum saponariae]|uniref:BZ3500_MvSof-1268-A1-R1_Chr7-3g09668 protein n=1 Tax=Microbotryum saponariae TaxID=289078 RepID=A0A2X0KZR3_9BASI|nr:BZ3501_MvSof-1269-A2-R1_Chr7-2g09391 [Microbotryum saponariae]SDA02379.1 BZ3500_MvSof-1268-A1-R1_Chr7-3g09668 [Microbotryum saponariae]
MNQLQVKYRGDRSPIARRQQSSPEPYLTYRMMNRIHMRMRTIRNSRQLWSRTVPATPKRIRQAIHTTESNKTAQRYYLTTSPTNCRTRRAEAFFSNIIFTTAEHNELRLRPLTHDWAPRKYECCLAVVKRPYGNARSSTHHQHPSDVAAWSQPAKVHLLWRFCGWSSLLGGLQKRSGT